MSGEPAERGRSPPKAASPKAASPAKSPPLPGSPALAGILSAQHWADQAIQNDDDDDSAYNSVLSSTASLSSSILEFRTIHGRTFHSKSTEGEYWGPNDEKQLASADILHHCLMLALGEKLYRAPFKKETVKKVLDVGTGTGIWAVDFADEHPAAEVIGFDISPNQPSWVPPNVKFEIDDACRPWTYPDNTFDFVHIRYLFGSINDWNALFKEAYRVLKPGGYIESYESASTFHSDDGSVAEGSALHQWGKVFVEAGKKSGRSFSVIEDNTQLTALLAAGFVNLDVFDTKCPVGPWMNDKKNKELGSFCQLALEQDIEGYVLYIWSQVMQWTHEEIQVYIAHLRRQLRDKKTHAYFMLRNIVARKPQ